MDVLGYLANLAPKTNGEIPKVDIHYTVRCHQFLHHYRAEVDSFLEDIEKKGTADVKFNWYCTKHQDETMILDTKKPETRINEIDKRISFDALFSRAPRQSTVYFVGNPSLTKHIEASCEKYKLPFIRDYTNGTFPKNDKNTMIRYFNGLVKSIMGAVIFLFILSIYVKSD